MRRPRFSIAIALALTGTLLAAPGLSAFVNNNRAWSLSSIALHLQLAQNGPPVIGIPSGTDERKLVPILHSGIVNPRCDATGVEKRWRIYGRSFATIQNFGWCLV